MNNETKTSARITNAANVILTNKKNINNSNAAQTEINPRNSIKLNSFSFISANET